MPRRTAALIASVVATPNTNFGYLMLIFCCFNNAVIFSNENNRANMKIMYKTLYFEL